MEDLDIKRLTVVRERVSRLDAQLAEQRARRDANEKELVAARRGISELERELHHAEADIVLIVAGRPTRSLPAGYKQPKDEG